MPREISVRMSALDRHPPSSFISSMPIRAVRPNGDERIGQRGHMLLAAAERRADSRSASTWPRPRRAVPSATPPSCTTRSAIEVDVVLHLLVDLVEQLVQRDEVRAPSRSSAPACTGSAGRCSRPAAGSAARPPWTRVSSGRSFLVVKSRDAARASSPLSRGAAGRVGGRVEARGMDVSLQVRIRAASMAAGSRHRTTLKSTLAAPRPGP